MLLSYFKKTFMLMLLIPVLGGVTIAQEPAAIAAYLKAGNAKEIAQFFDKRVVIAIDGQSNNYSSQQGEIILKNFLSRFSSRNFSILHKGASQGNAQYMVGNLQTNQGVFRTSIYISSQTIQEIRFEKND
jgi:hypothetical protein